MDEKYLKIAKAIQKLTETNTETNTETDASAISWETGLPQPEILQILKDMEAQNWICIYEIDMCCGAEYVVDGLTENGKAALLS